METVLVVWSRAASLVHYKTYSSQLTGIQSQIGMTKSALFAMKIRNSVAKEVLLSL